MYIGQVPTAGEIQSKSIIFFSKVIYINFRHIYVCKKFVTTQIFLLNFFKSGNIAILQIKATL